jgi:predicted amidohydrolase YtcJ
MHYSVIAEPLVDLGDAVDLADIAARITAHAANIPAGQWIMATPVGEPHYFLRRSYRDLTQGQLPDRTIMDAAAPNPPCSFRRGRRSFRTPASSTLRASDDSASPATPLGIGRTTLYRYLAESDED